MRKNTKWLGFLLIFALFNDPAYGARRTASEGQPELELAKRAQSLSAENKTDEAARLLTERIQAEQDKEKRGVLRLALAMLLIRAGQDGPAETQFTQALEDGLRIDDYARLQLGLLYKRAGKLKEAAVEFDKVIGAKAPNATVSEARLHLGEVRMAEKNWKAAASLYATLRQSMRSSSQYPVVLYNLMVAERRLGRVSSSCKWARELYSKYPTQSLVKSWSLQLEKNTIEGGESLGCSASDQDMKTRIRRLQLGGEADRALAELRDLKARSGGEGSYSIDSMIANHLISEGAVDEAMKLLLKHHGSQNKRAPYLLLLAKAASRAGDYKGAIGSYMRAYDLAPKARTSAHPLFQAAFTSYQIQDYDGATRKFQQLVKTFPTSNLSRDARWLMAWMQYLRGDYPGAYERLKDLGQARTIVKKTRKGRRVVVKADALAQDRVRYWSAMSLLRMGKTQEAVPVFQSLARDPAIGFYSVAAYYRLTSIPGAKLPPGTEIRLGLRKATDGGVAPSEEELKQASEEVEAAQAEYEGHEAVASAVDGADDESEAPAEGVETGDVEVADGAESGESTDTFKDAGMASRFARARDLALVGLEDAARRELMEIERRAHKPEDRRLLMNEYVQVRNYYRSSYMGEVGFGAQRLRGGLVGESRQFWEFAYPRAWDGAVMQASKSTLVPEEFIWGIMRAESHFKQDATSVVGALGLMQLMPFTGRQVASLLSISSFETHSLLDPETNIRLGSRYLQRLLEKFSGSVPLAAAGYNAGPHRVHAWVRNFGSLDMDEFIEHIPFVETRNYVKKVVRNYQIYNLLYAGGSHSMEWLAKPVGVQMSEQIPTKEVW